jgi:hypothetical protein
MAECVRRITARVSIPLIADGDTGHGNGSSVAWTVRQFEATGDFVQSLTLAAPYLAAGTQDGRLRIWNTAAGTVLHTLEPSPAPTK